MSSTKYRPRVKPSQRFTQGQAQTIKSRGISKETCDKFGYINAKDGNDWVQAATYYTDFGEPVAQKVRTQDKKFRWVGDTKKANLFGQHLWGDTERKKNCIN